MSGLVVAGEGRLERLEAVKGNESAPGVIFQRVCDGEGLGEIARGWGVPKGRFVEWFSVEHAGLYDAALKVLAADLALEALEASRGAEPDTVGVMKLRAEVALKLAGKWDRERYGERVKVEAPVRPSADAALVGMAAALLGQIVTQQRERVVAHVPADASAADLI